MNRLCLIMMLASAGCSTESAASEGKAWFSKPSLSGSESNFVACSDCHATSEEHAERIFAGATMAGVTSRTSYWGGQVLDLRGAVNACLRYFMRGSTAETLLIGDERGLELLAYLDTLDNGVSEPVAFTVSATLDEDLPAGDASRGETLFAKTCHTCHGDPETGAGAIADFAPIIPTETIMEHADFARTITIAKIRHGGFYGIGGNMPPFSTEVLSAQNVADILSYLTLDAP